MFIAAEFQSMRRICLTELEKLLKILSIQVPDWSGDEYRIYEKLDTELERKTCALMKSSSIIEGYTNLLKLGGIGYDFSELDSELLRKIVANKEKILRGLENLPKFIEVEVEQSPEPQPIMPSRPSQPKTKTITNEEHVTLKGPIILGIFLIVVGLAVTFMLGIFGIILIVLGVASLIAGVRGKTKRETVTVPVKEKIPAPQPVAQPVRQKQIVRREVKPPFTRNELQRVLDVLAQVDKIVRAI